MKPLNKYAIIVAGGSGARMGGSTPKQFLTINGLPILMHTIRTFSLVKNLHTIIAVLPHSEHLRWQQLCEQHSFGIKHTLVNGGETRYHSVKNGLAAIYDNGLVAIHDGVRPLVSVDLINRCFDHANTQGNAIPAVKPVESIRLGSACDSKTGNRDEYWLVQTPQVFTIEQIKPLYKNSWQPQFTDDASVAENYGIKISLIEGERQNIKITTPFDLTLAETLLRKV